MTERRPRVSFAGVLSRSPVRKGKVLVARSRDLTRRWSDEQRAVRALLFQRWQHGLGLALGKELNVSNHHVSAFKRGVRPFPAAKLRALREALLRANPDRQSDVRRLFVRRLAQGRVRAADVARAYGIHRSTVSRFQGGTLPFPVERLEEFEAYLKALPRDRSVKRWTGRERYAPTRQRNAKVAETEGPRPPVAEQTHLRRIVEEMARRFAGAILEVVATEPLGDVVRSARRT